jgi:Zn-dependent protease with chaperone function
MVAVCFLLAVLTIVPQLKAVQAPAGTPAPTATTQESGSQGQAYHLPPDKLAKAIALSRVRSILHFAGAIWGLAVLWLLLATGAAAGLEAWVRSAVQKRWVQGLLFFAVLIIILTVASLPLDMYAQHVSLSYGISVQGWGSWFGDQGKALGLSVVFGALVMLLFQWIVRKWPRRYWVGVWVATLPLLILTIFVSPLLEPIFDKFEPLAKNHAALVDELEKVAQRTGTNIPPERMFLMKASVKTNGLNAYVSGIGATKRIVVWDTTAGRVPDDVVMFVFGHESGHYVLNHIPKMIAIYAVILFFIYWACARLAEWLAKRFGERWRLDISAPLACRAGFVVLLFAISLAGFVIEPPVNAVSRHFEHEADVYGQEAVHGLVADPQKTGVAGFNALGEAWLEDPNPNPVIEFWEYSHPSVKNRANFAAHYDPWANGGRGEFFER